MPARFRILRLEYVVMPLQWIVEFQPFGVDYPVSPAGLEQAMLQEELRGPVDRFTDVIVACSPQILAQAPGSGKALIERRVQGTLRGIAVPAPIYHCHTTRDRAIFLIRGSSASPSLLHTPTAFPGSDAWYLQSPPIF